ncbi:MAG: enoyl-CoA hydratase/isomerase family protein [Deltaproteobacteria bacterium]|nr:enoyl-CoA hydratase/isomerase family protein [Deltaproteobacteria bacterium]
MSFVIQKEEGPLTRIILNRPEVKNSLNEELISELTTALLKVFRDKDCRLVILSGQDGFFCAGADLQWMKEIVSTSKKTLAKRAAGFQRLLSLLNDSPRPTIAQISGGAAGGGLGLIACCDIAIASEESSFVFREVKVGLIPALISPYLIAKTGSSWARRYFLTGERFSAQEAKRVGLLHEVVPGEQLESKTMTVARELFTSGPEAVQRCKKLVKSRSGSRRALRELLSVSSSKEAREGIQAFLAGRKPSWSIG